MAQPSFTNWFRLFYKNASRARVKFKTNFCPFFVERSTKIKQIVPHHFFNKYIFLVCPFSWLELFGGQIKIFAEKRLFAKAFRYNVPLYGSLNKLKIYEQVDWEWYYFWVSEKEPNKEPILIFHPWFTNMMFKHVFFFALDFFFPNLFRLQFLKFQLFYFELFLET